MKKRLLSLLSVIISIFMLCSCGLVSKTPTAVAKDYIKDIKSNLDNDISNSIISAIASSENEETINKTKESLKKALSKLEVEVTDESIKETSAIVTLNIKGISLTDVTSNVLTELQTTNFIDEITTLSSDEYSKKITNLILETLDNAQVEDRTCTLTLNKKDDNYTLSNSKDELCEFFWGININKLNSLKH